MCGIFLVNSKNNIKLEKNRCLLAAKDLFNRGPDSFKSEFFLNDKLFISNTVLSITGKLNNNKKLIRSKNKNLAISFNGEIYNYLDLNKKFNSFKTRANKLSDTELLINLHENYSTKNVINKLNGMYAYVIYDIKKKNILIANDPQGEKNLYYYENKNFFIISSTISSILKYLKVYKLNFKTLKNYFYSRHYMPLEETCFNGIKLFPNGIIGNYSLINKKIEIKEYDNPINWVSKKKYNFFNKLSENEMINYFEKALIKQLKIMIPNKNFGCIASGGIDSTLQAAMISKIKKAKMNLVVNHHGKDKIIKHIPQFNNYLFPKINILKSNKNIYSKKIKNCYDIVSSPLQTHDLVGRVQTSEVFKKNKCKVFFSADGCDELLGGQQLYHDLYKNIFNYKYNQSPYSSIKNLGINFDNHKVGEYKKKLEKYWKSVFSKYSFLNLKERNIQSSLFTDYFIQSRNVANRSNDLIACNYSIEPRNVYIQKPILKILINLPLKYKINFDNPDKKMIQKPLLKKLFTKYFNEKLILPKEGFSGFPNNIKKTDYLLTKKNLIIKKKKNREKIYKYIDKNNLNRDVNWKFINTENFLERFV